MSNPPESNGPSTGVIRKWVWVAPIFAALFGGLTWWFGPGIGCKGSRMIPLGLANGLPAYAQYKPSETGDGYDPWAIQVLELSDGRIARMTFFLETETLFPLFGLAPHLDA